MKRDVWIFAALAGLAVALLFVLPQLADDAPAADARVIDVLVKRYDYAPGSLASINVTQGERITLRLTSADVTHGFAIEGYGIHIEVPAGETVDVTFVADRAGDFTIYCTVFCGGGHPEHKGTLHVA